VVGSECGPRTALGAHHTLKIPDRCQHSAPMPGGATGQQGENLTVRSEKYGWIGNEFFAKANPCSATILGFRTEESEKGERVILLLKNDAGVLGEMDLYGTNFNRLVQKEPDDSKWSGVRVRLGQALVDGKRRRVLDVL